MLDFLGIKFGKKKSKQQQQQPLPKILVPERTEYKSKLIDIPDAFLAGPPPKDLIINHVPFKTSAVPEYADCIALTLDNVLTPEECLELRQFAEASVPTTDAAQSPWRPAMLNVGAGIEVTATDIRNSGRIVWDQREVADRIWKRCLFADGLERLLSTTPEDHLLVSGKWEFDRANERMRFLKYTPGQFFKAHCDGAYRCVIDGKEGKTHYTLHLYLNGENEEDELEGGATSFLSKDETRRLDVNPKTGSVLIFQHRSLYHEGAIVTKGTKYTMRTDLLYKLDGH